MTKPALLVDGHMEQKIAQRLCPGAPVMILNINGSDVQLSAIAKQVASQFRLLNNRYYPVVVLIDRECRAETAKEIRESLLCELAKNQIPTDQFIIGVADRMIENWILADLEGVGLGGSDGVAEGCDGKSVLRNMLETNGVNYHETTVGVDLFCLIRPFVAAEKCSSFKDFIEQIKNCCSWAGQQQCDFDY